MNNESQPVRLIRLPQLCAKLQLSRSTIYNKTNRNSRLFDPTFPKSRKIGASAVAWVESEVDDWIRRVL